MSYELNFTAQIVKSLKYISSQIYKVEITLSILLFDQMSSKFLESNISNNWSSFK